MNLDGHSCYTVSLSWFSNFFHYTGIKIINSLNLVLDHIQDNPSEKDINQGTLVVFNLDASVSNDDLRRIFGAYGEVKEVFSKFPLYALLKWHVYAERLPQLVL